MIFSFAMSAMLRFVWNFFRLENEHLNNCGQFRVVRDISIAPVDMKVVIKTMVDKKVLFPVIRKVFAIILLIAYNCKVVYTFLCYVSTLQKRTRPFFMSLIVKTTASFFLGPRGVDNDDGLQRWGSAGFL